MVVLIVMLITIVKKERKKMIKQSCKLDIVIPSLGRKVKLERCIESIRKAKFQHDVHLYLYFSIKEELDYFKKTTKDKDWITCKTVKNYRVPDFWNKHLKTMKADAMMYLNDDIILFGDTITNALEYMSKVYPDYDGVIGINQFNIPINQMVKTAFGVIGTKFANRFPDRQVFCPDYDRFYADQELFVFSDRVHKFTFCNLVRLEHDHPVFNKNSMDATHKNVRQYLSSDKTVFHNRRMKNLIWGVNFELNKESNLLGAK